MGIWEAVKKGFQVATKSTDLVLTLFVFGFVWNLINVFVSSKLQSTDPMTSAIIIAIGIIFILLTVYMQAGSIGYVRDRIKQGSASLSNFTAAGSKYYGRLFVIGLIVTLIIFVFVILAAIVFALLNPNPALNVLAISIVVFLAVVGIYVLILLFLAPYIAIADEKKAMLSIKESVACVKKNFLKLLGIILVLIVIGFVIGLVLGILFAGISLVLKGLTSQIVFAFLSSLVNSFLGLLVTGSFMAFYLALSNKTTTQVAE